jgi:D-3-phosphoglycerate dehydrogenase
MGVELCNKTLGIIGLGNVGRIVAERALGLRMKVIGYDPFVPAEAAARLGVEQVSLDEIYARSDFITVHTPMTSETQGLINRSAFAKMKKGVRIVNCARGGIVDEEALAQASIRSSRWSRSSQLPTWGPQRMRHSLMSRLPSRNRWSIF